MATLTVRNLEEETRNRLARLASLNGRSLEEEAKAILRAATEDSDRGTGARLYRLSRELFSGGDGVDLDLPTRGQSDGPAPDFSGPEHDAPGHDAPGHDASGPAL
jgi:antitoxin FitA